MVKKGFILDENGDITDQMEGLVDTENTLNDVLENHSKKVQVINRLEALRGENYDELTEKISLNKSTLEKASEFAESSTNSVVKGIEQELTSMEKVNAEIETKKKTLKEFGDWYWGMMLKTQKKQDDFNKSIIEGLTSKGKAISPFNIISEIDYQGSNDLTKSFIDASHAIEAASNYTKVFEQQLDPTKAMIEVTANALNNLDKEMQKSGKVTENQIGLYKQWSNDLQVLTQQDILNELANQMENVRISNELFGNSFEDTEIKISALRTALSRLKSMDKLKFSPEGLIKYKEAVEALTHELTKLERAYKVVDALQTLADITGEIANVIAAAQDNKLAKIEAAYKKEMETYEKSAKVYGENEELKARIEEKYAKQRQARERKAALWSKLLAMAQIEINTQVAASKALLEGDIAKAIGIGLAGKLQVAAVAITAIPQMAKGGEVPSGFPNDSYPAWLSSGERVIPAPKALNNDMWEREQMNINVIVDGVVKGTDIHYIVKEVSRKYSNSYI
jgi:hypothetical protein